MGVIRTQPLLGSHERETKLPRTLPLAPSAEGFHRNAPPALTTTAWEGHQSREVTTPEPLVLQLWPTRIPGEDLQNKEA